MCFHLVLLVIINNPTPHRAAMYTYTWRELACKLAARKTGRKRGGPKKVTRKRARGEETVPRSRVSFATLI